MYERTQMILASIGVILCGVQNLPAIFALGSFMMLVALVHHFTNWGDRS